MLEGAGREELGEDFWGPSEPPGMMETLSKGCAEDSMLTLVFMAIMFTIGWNLRRTKKVR